MAAAPIARCGRRTWRSLLKLCDEQELRAKLLQSLAVMKGMSDVGCVVGLALSQFETWGCLNLTACMDVEHAGLCRLEGRRFNCWIRSRAIRQKIVSPRL